MLLVLAVLQVPLAFAQIDDSSINNDWMTYFTDIDNLTSQFAVDVYFPELIGYSIGMVIYGFFIWNFYRFIARREMIPVCLEKYQSSGRKAVEVVGIEVNLIDGLDTDKIETITDLIETKIMTIIPNSQKEYIFVEIQR